KRGESGLRSLSGRGGGRTNSRVRKVLNDGEQLDEVGGKGPPLTVPPSALEALKLVTEVTACHKRSQQADRYAGAGGGPTSPELRGSRRPGQREPGQDHPEKSIRWVRPDGQDDEIEDQGAADRRTPRDQKQPVQ